MRVCSRLSVICTLWLSLIVGGCLRCVGVHLALLIPDTGGWRMSVCWFTRCPFLVVLHRWGLCPDSWLFLRSVRGPLVLAYGYLYSAVLTFALYARFTPLFRTLLVAFGVKGLHFARFMSMVSFGVCGILWHSLLVVG